MKMIFSLYLMLCAVGFIHMAHVSTEYIKHAILDGHNLYAKRLQEWTWNDGLVQFAEELAWSCDTNEMTGQAINYGYDTNPRNADLSVSKIMSTWFGKKERMVMANANSVGCGANICPKFRASGKEYKNAFDLVCIYDAGPCKDSVDAQQCQRWAELGECDKYPKQMLVKCKKTCKVC